MQDFEPHRIRREPENRESKDKVHTGSPYDGLQQKFIDIKIPGKLGTPRDDEQCGDHRAGPVPGSAVIPQLVSKLIAKNRNLVNEIDGGS